MKNSLRLFATALCLLGFNLAYSQTIVSTTPENKNVILEEFTGIYCTYCPAGHVIAQGIQTANPGDVVLVNIHVGGYADPGTSGDPDFRTPWGTALAGQSDLTGYPSATVNRHVFAGLEMTPGGTAMGRGDWTDASGQILPQSSPVNVAATCELDVNTKTMTIYVEVYYTGNSSASTNKLNIAVIENNIPGPQTGGTNGNPDNFDAQGNYLHQDVFRDFVNGQWGEDITPTTAGSFYSNTFTYTIPSSYIGIVPNLGEMSVAVYVAEGQQEVISGAYAALTFTGITETNNAALVSIDDLGAVCGTVVSPTVLIKNMGSADLVSLDITYDVNGGASQSYSWTGNLSSYKQETITLPPVSFTASGTNTVNVTFSNPNGSADEDTSDDQASSTFTDAPQTDVVLAFELLTDDWGLETTWDLTNASGTILYSGGPYNGQNNTTFNETFYLGEGCHTFSIYDDYGDGLDPQGGTPGYYTITDLSSNVIFTGISFGSEDVSPFDAVCASLGTINLTTVESTCSASDGSASCTVTGTSGPYTYLWSNGQTTSTATNLAAGEYFVTVTDAMTCTEVKSIIVNNAGAATLSSFAPTNACWNVADGIINLTVNGGTSPFTYAWNNGATSSNLTGLGIGTYTVTVTDGAGCISLNTAEVTAAAEIIVTSTVNDENLGDDGAIYLSTSGGTGAYTYSWTGPNAYTASTEDISGLSDGNYSVEIKDGFGCILTKNYTVGASVGISMINNPIEMMVFPNPFSESATVQFTLRKAENVSIGMYNLVGQEILMLDQGTMGVGDHLITLDGSELVQGIYFVNVRIGENSYLKKLIHTK